LYRKEYLTKLGKLLPSGNQAENTLSQLFKDYMTGKLSIREVEELWTSYVNNNKRVRLPLPGATDYSVWGQKSVPQSPKTLAHANRIEVRKQIRRLATTPLNTADLQNLANGNLESTVGISPADNLQYMSQDELNQVMSNARQTLASREQQ
jgi:methionine synthase II (cobalamin-independent)